MAPGLGCSARLYEGLLPYVWRYGTFSIVDTRRDDSLGGMAERLLSEAPSRFALIGLSMGGYLAFEVMRRAPERVLALGLISTSARPDSAEQTERRTQQLTIIEGGGFDKMVKAVGPTLVAESRRDDPALLSLLSEMAHEVGPEAYCRQIIAVRGRLDSRPLLSTISCPTSVIHGSNDQVLPLECAEEIASGIPGARLTVVYGSGHMTPQEDLAAVAPAVEALLAGVAQT